MNMAKGSFHQLVKPVVARSRRAVLRSMLAGTAVLGLGARSVRGAAADATPAPQETGQVLHIVLIRRKDGVSDDQVEEVRTAIMALQEKIDGIERISWGGNINPEGLGDGFDPGFVVLFESTAARDAYLPHPDHQQVAPLVRAISDQVLVYDLMA
jgi:hypothetical protein